MIELGRIVRGTWSELLADGFVMTDEGGGRVVLASSSVRIVVLHSPRGEVEVRAHRSGDEEHLGWSYTGMVGRVSVNRVLELALEELRVDPALLTGDAEYFARVAQRRRDESRALQERAAGGRPKLDPGRLP